MRRSKRINNKLEVDDSQDESHTKLKMSSPKKLQKLNSKLDYLPKVDKSLTSNKKELDLQIVCKENVNLDVQSSSEDQAVDVDSFNYLKIREQNMKANQAFFASLGIKQERESLLQLKQKQLKSTKRGLKIKKEPPEPTLLRKSLRIRHIDPTGTPLPSPEPKTETSQFDARLPPGPIPMTDCVYSKKGTDSDEVCNPVSSLICGIKPVLQAETSVDLKKFVARLNKIKTTEYRVAKVVPGRVFSLTWHPSPDILLAFAGDKYGHIGLWHVPAEDTVDDAHVEAFKPHSKPVSHLSVIPAAPNKLFSCSYDATLRCGDFEHGVFNDVYSVPEENDDLFRNFNFVDAPNTLLLSQFSGNVTFLDIRNPHSASKYPVSKKSLRSVSVNPVDSNYFITAGIDPTVQLWDLRYMGSKTPKPIQSLHDHHKAVSSAFFSPQGTKVLSCAADDTIMVYTVNKDMTLQHSIKMKHNNFTGRWLTKFQPNWHPTVEGVFVSGSMNRPREIEVFNADGTLLRSLTDENWLGSVCSLNVFHPNTTCTVVGANSSGRLHVFM
ncbi:WD repeat-containing protein 76-like [Physella acuta]|uniref:WD repeat-containing protein 76-like n=1 Tax=Physella acuta TaxID=109671 RepID=UPI0027DDC8DB|nr:WD repeat-containing protein 76-like [Physella acuta]